MADDALLVAKGSVFQPCGRGRLAAAGAPGKKGVAKWVAAGCTAVVSLQRDDEFQPGDGSVAAQCLRAGITWLHLPLTGRGAVGRERTAADSASLARVGEVASLLSPAAADAAGASVVVHCSAGMHRTGMVCYLALRLCGRSIDEALATLVAMRKVTHDEVVARHSSTYFDRSESTSIADLAEEFYQTTLLPTKAL